MNKQDEKKQNILRKGLRSLYLKGYNATGVKEIADAAEIPKGSFYNYFKTKEEFAIEAMQLFTDREIHLIEKVLSDKSLSPLRRIEKLYQVKIDHFVEKGSFSLGCFLCNITLEMADVSQPIADAASKMFQSEDLPVIACLREAQEMGEIAAKTNIDELSDLIRDSWLGALVIMKAQKSPKPLYNFLRNLRNYILINKA